jgi:hypothetical protein
MSVKDRLKIAGRELMKGNVVKAISSFAIQPSNYNRSDNGSGFWFFQDGSPDVHFSYAGTTSSLIAYTCCPPVAAIINRKAQAYINGKTWVLNAAGDKKGKEAVSSVADKLRALIARPNAIQSWSQFEAQNYIYQQIRGYCVVLPIVPVGFKRIDAKAMWNIPPWMLDIKEKQNINLANAENLKDFIESIDIIWQGARTPLNLDDVYIFRDFTPSSSSMVLPESRILANSQPINNIIGALESRGVLIDKRGPSYVISSNKSDESGQIPLSAAEKKSVEEDFQKYGLRRKQMQAIITSANINLATVGFSTKELMLFEEVEDSVMRLCDGYNYPYRLLSSNKNNSLGGSDITAFKQLLYDDAIIPESTSMYSQWNQFFDLAKYGLTLDKDYAHISALQADKVKEAQARKTLNEALKMEWELGLITLDDWNKKLGEDPLPDGMGQVRATDPKTSNVPLAVTIGVGGVQSLIQVLTARGISEEAKRNTVEIVFGISSEDAGRMVVGSDAANQSGNTGNNNSQNQP